MSSLNKNNVLSDALNWDGELLADIQNALKEKLREMDTNANGGVSSISLSVNGSNQLVVEVTRADGTKRAASYDVSNMIGGGGSVVMGRIVDGMFYPVTRIEGGNAYADTPLTNPDTGKLYIDMPHGNIYRYNPNLSDPWDRMSKITVDGTLSSTSNNPISNKAVTLALEDKLEEADIAGKADKLAGMLHPGQWPKVVVRNITASQIDDLLPGDVYFDDQFYLHTNGDPIPLGGPQEGTLYYCLADNKTYYWRGNSWNLAGGSGTGTVQSVSVNGGQPVQPVNGNVNLQGVATEDYVDDAVDDKLTQVVVNEMTGAADIITIDDADLAFIDEDGNIAMRVAEGHVETQHFDSRQVGTNTTAIQQLQQQIAQAGSNVQADVAVKEDSDAAFDISDPNGNVVLRVGADGHIETKGFNSNEVSSADVFRATKMTPNCVVHGRLPINGIGPNSIALFKEAYRVGYRWFECDSKPCRDNGAILTHAVGPFTIYAKNDQSQTPITVNDFSGYDSTDLADNYTWTASTYTDGVLTTEGKPMETLAEAIWYVCYFLRCPLHVDKLGLTVAAQYQASSYAESLGVGQYVFHEIGRASDLANYANWDIPLNMIFFLSGNYLNDIASISSQYKTKKNNIIFYFGKSTSTPSATLKTIADATHKVGCYAMTWDFLTSQIDELRRWFKAGFDFLLTTGITNADV